MWPLASLPSKPSAPSPPSPSSSATPSITPKSATTSPAPSPSAPISSSSSAATSSPSPPPAPPPPSTSSAAAPAASSLSTTLFLPRHPGPLILVGWTLNFEVLFYLWLAFVIHLRPVAFRAAAALGPALAALVNPIFLLFAAGSLLRPLPFWCLPLGLALWLLPLASGIGDIWDCTLTTFAANSARRLTLWGLPALLIVGAAAGQAHRPVPAFLLYLGRESYAIYLCQHHGLILAAHLPLLSSYPRALYLTLAALAFSLAFSHLASRRKP